MSFTMESDEVLAVRLKEGGKTKIALYINSASKFRSLVEKFKIIAVDVVFQMFHAV